MEIKEKKKRKKQRGIHLGEYLVESGSCSSHAALHTWRPHWPHRACANTVYVYYNTNSDLLDPSENAETPPRFLSVVGNLPPHPKCPPWGKRQRIREGSLLNRVISYVVLMVCKITLWRWLPRANLLSYLMLKRGTSRNWHTDLALLKVRSSL